jgi:hypothetical protein
MARIRRPDLECPVQIEMKREEVDQIADTVDLAVGIVLVLPRQIGSAAGDAAGVGHLVTTRLLRLWAAIACS